MYGLQCSYIWIINEPHSQLYFSSILRSEGDVNRATIAANITAVLNIIIDPIFIYYLNMGIAGAAWATVISAGISCIVMAYWIWVKKDTYMNLSFDQFKSIQRNCN